MTFISSHPSFLQSSVNTLQLNSESFVDKKLTTRQELFSDENSISTIKQKAIFSDLRLGNNEREKLFKNKRLKQKFTIESTESISAKLSIPKDFYDKCCAMEVQMQQLEEFITKIKNNTNIQHQYEGLVGLRKLLSLTINPPVQEIIDYGIIPIFLSFLELSFPEFQYETLWCIINLGPDQANSLINIGGIPKIVKLLNTSIEQLLNQTIWTLGNLASNSIQASLEIIDLKGLDKIILILSMTNNHNVIKQCTYTISHLFRTQHQYSYEIFQRALIYIIKGVFILSQDIEFLSDAMFFIMNISENYKKSIETILESGLLPFLFEIIK